MKRKLCWIRIVCACILILGLLGCSGSCAKEKPGDVISASAAPQNNETEPEIIQEDEVKSYNSNGNTDPQPTLPTDTETPADTEVPAVTNTPVVTKDPEATQDPLEIDIPITTSTPTPTPTPTPKPGETAKPTPTPTPTPTATPEPTPEPTQNNDPIELPELP